ncbi:hypothetical protein L1987_52884 [Smallanthus sonchifolius]|uniref:Uncharacterized protein n=1 Tax=Smallanthus sonchifolius TaxID=185202 RepID=A0ACB9EUB7_9ASTR|nr:hypothetical protein L1987_52884 [Smallanthus sonchifolius]
MAHLAPKIKDIFKELYLSKYCGRQLMWLKLNNKFDPDDKHHIVRVLSTLYINAIYALLLNSSMQIYLEEEDLARESRLRLSLIDFLKGLVEFDPAKRWSPLQASKHPFVTGEPFTCPYMPAPEAYRVVLRACTGILVQLECKALILEAGSVALLNKPAANQRQFT